MGKQDDMDFRKKSEWKNPLKAVRLKCLDCCADSPSLVAECHIYNCSLWPYRFGKRPGTMGKKLFNFPDPAVFDIENVQDAIERAGTVPVNSPELADE